MERTSVNPWDWGLAYSMDQGELVTSVSRHLHCSGQVAVEPDPNSPLGIKVLHAGDVREQMESTLTNIDAVLEAAGLTGENILTLRFFTTNIDEFLENYDVYAAWIAPAGIRPPQSLPGVSRLLHPDLTVEIKALAGD